jgi:hypothetical protein
MEEWIVNLIVLALAGAGMLAQYLLKQSRARASRPVHRPIAPAARDRSSLRPTASSTPRSEPRVASFEDVLAQLLGGELGQQAAGEAPPPRPYRKTAPPPPPEPPAVTEQPTEVPARAVEKVIALDAGTAAAQAMPPALAALAGRATTDLRAVIVLKEIFDPPISLR